VWLCQLRFTAHHRDRHCAYRQAARIASALTPFAPAFDLFFTAPESDSLGGVFYFVRGFAQSPA
jgi:hypothetical protein